MPDVSSAPAAPLPSSRTLLRSTLIAIAVAIVLLVIAVLPAEYGVDPTGVGRVLGLTEMGEIKMQLAKEAAIADSLDAVLGGPAVRNPGPSRAADTEPVASEPPTPAAAQAPRPDSANSHVMEIVLRPNEGKEIKLAMRKDARVTYSWSTDRGVVNYDTHADAPGIRYHGYGKGTATPSDEGTLTAAFDGMHGWFWRNRGQEVVTVTLRTSGEYQELKRM